ncbi:cortex morphogenetic protein CmpA [Paenibacillus abyssi]|nr:cortex morphogenetic protein CmpA [Paenibacillus abyssi]
MPQWLCNQLMRAFLKKDRRQIRLLNDCWFFYRTKSQPADQHSAGFMP